MRLDPTMSWVQIRAAAEDAKTRGVIFESARSPQRYKVTHVDPYKIKIHRMDAPGQDSKCDITPELVNEIVTRINKSSNGLLWVDEEGLKGHSGQGARTMVGRLHPLLTLEVQPNPETRKNRTYFVIRDNRQSVSEADEMADRDAAKSVRETPALVSHSIPLSDVQQAPPPANSADVNLDNAVSKTVVVEPILLSSEEGKRLLKVHSRIERKPELTREKKRLAKLNHSGRLICACCGFDYVAIYGSLGNDFIECHHIQPLGSRLESMETKLEDLVLVCANCHRMLHRGSTLLTVDELRDRMNLEFRSLTRSFFERRP